jgi:Icc-related predicted phosphoesterase
MRWRALSLIPQFLWNRVRYGRYVDILIAHAPAEGIHDSPAGAHKGFGVFLQLMRWFKPRIFLHGHNHRYGPGEWHTRYAGTDVVNVHPFCIVNYSEEAVTFNNLRRQEIET